MKQPDLTFVLRGCFFVFKEKIKKKLKGSYLCTIKLACKVAWSPILDGSG